MYTLVLTIHSWVRWLALAAGILATFAAADHRAAPDRSRVDRWGLLFMVALDVQLLLGLALYFSLSPFTAAAFQDFGAAMRTPAFRFWAVEHVGLMLVAVVLVHAGRVLARRAS